FNKNLSLNSIFNVPLSFELNIGGNLEFSLPSFSADDYVRSPDLATHFKLMIVVGLISDFEFNENTKSYEPKNGELNELSDIIYSDYMPTTGEVPSTEIMTPSNAYDEKDDPSCTLFMALGIEFYHKFNQDYLPVSSGACMRIFHVE